MLPRDEDNIVCTWLRFLHVEEYSSNFLDNGYDDLETVKQIGPADLDAVGVVSVHHRAFLLDAVRVLREQGAAWVYLLLGAKENRQVMIGELNKRMILISVLKLNLMFALTFIGENIK